MEPNPSRETSSDILTILTYDGRTVTRINVGTQTYEDLDYKPKYVLLKGTEDHYDSLEQRADDESELKISPDNEMLDLHSKGTPHSPTACQEGTEETLTNLDKGVIDGESDKEGDQRRHDLKSKEGSHEDRYTYSESGVAKLFETGSHFTGHVDSYVTSSDFSDYESSTTEEGALEGEREMSYNSIFSFNVRKERLKMELDMCATRREDLPSSRQRRIQRTCPVWWSWRTKSMSHRLRRFLPAVSRPAFMRMATFGGTLYSETGDVKKRWKWQENEQHVHAPPCQPFHLTLSPFLKVHIQSQEDISILFNSNKHSVEVIKEASVITKHVSKQTAPVHDSLKSYLKQKSPEIKALLQNIQSLATYQSSETPPKVDPHPADGKAAAASETATLPRRPPKAGDVLQ